MIKNKILRETLSIIGLIFLALLFRSVAYEPYYIPSSSMYPNLLIGDRIIISKFSYGISNYSFPLSPNLFKGRKLVKNMPERGDVIVFELDKVYIKRLIGLPGDQIQFSGGVIYINGEMVPRQLIGDISIDGEEFKKYMQKLPEGKTYDVLDTDIDKLGDNTGIYTVPEGKYFMVGDNMDNSLDSRFARPNGLSFVPFENLLGKAEWVFFSSYYEIYKPIKFIKNFRPDRLFKAIK